MNIHIEKDNTYICKDVNCDPIVTEHSINVGDSYWIEDSEKCCIRFPYKLHEFYLIKQYRQSTIMWKPCGDYIYNLCNDYEEMLNFLKRKYVYCDTCSRNFGTINDMCIDRSHFKFINEFNFKELIDTFKFKGIIGTYYVDIEIILIGHINKHITTKPQLF